MINMIILIMRRLCTELQTTKISTVLKVTLLIFTLLGYRKRFSGTYRYYDYLKREELESVLYKKVHPDAWKVRGPHCSYKQVLNSKDVVNSWDVVRDSWWFKGDGIIKGSYSPLHCNPLFSVAVIVTYRDREKQLKIFVPYIHNFLRNQHIHYKIYLVEQDDSLPWNKGLLYNVGARAAIASGFPCLILHDVDLLPLARANLYACTTQPRHLSVNIDLFRYILPYETLVGGVLAITSNQFETVNGYSNLFLGWGGEDDDMADRILIHNFSILRGDPDASQYTMLQHSHARPNPERRSLLARKEADGVASAAADGLRSLHYRSLTQEDHQLYTHLKIKT